jgi:transketolase
VERVKAVAPVAEKFRAFGWNALEVDGHALEAILEALAAARACEDRPSVIVARTVKGKGVSFCEGRVEWHGKAPSDAELARALAELEARRRS